MAEISSPKTVKLKARRYINGVACGFLEYNEDDTPKGETMKPMVDGGTEGFKGHARVIVPRVTPCFECTIWLFPLQVKFPLGTIAETPRNAAHCIEYAHLIKWHEVHGGKSFDPDEPERMKWVYDEAIKRAELFGIPGVTYSLTQGVVKNIIPAIASAACALETLEIVSGCSKTLANYLTYNGGEGLHTKVTEFVRDQECLVWDPGILIELDTSITLQKFIEMLEEHPKLLLSKASVKHGKDSLYMQAPPVLEEMHKPSLSKPLDDLMGRVQKDTIHVLGTALKNEEKQSSLTKLRVVFKVADGIVVESIGTAREIENSGVRLFTNCREANNVQPKSITVASIQAKSQVEERRCKEGVIISQFITSTLRTRSILKGPVLIRWEHVSKGDHRYCSTTAGGLRPIRGQLDQHKAHKEDKGASEGC